MRETPRTRSFCMHCGATLTVDGSNWLELQQPAGTDLERIPLLQSPFVLGRGSSADYPFESTRISRKHAEITRSSVGWHIRDLGSTNGTKVQEQRLRLS